MTTDSATDYERHARTYLEARDRSTIGRGVVATWARSLEAGTEVLEIGCGGGLPVTRALVDSRLRVWAMDSSPTLLAAFRERFPDVPVDCASVLESSFFGRTFGAAIAVGVMFLLSEDDQEALIRRISRVLEPGGCFLFSAPEEIGTWEDVMTGTESVSLGRERYEEILGEAGFRVIASHEDEGRNHYYEAERSA